MVGLPVVQQLEQIVQQHGIDILVYSAAAMYAMHLHNTVRKMVRDRTEHTKEKTILGNYLKRDVSQATVAKISRNDTQQIFSFSLPDKRYIAVFDFDRIVNRDPQTGEVKIKLHYSVQAVDEYLPRKSLQQ